MLNFKDYLNNKKEAQQKATQQSAEKNVGENVLKNESAPNLEQLKKQLGEEELAKAENVIKKYAGLNREELMTEIAKTIKQQKSNNSFDKTTILEKLKSMSGFLTSEQTKQISELLDEAEAKD